jgi:DNA invertase Pin-like site-specific DNA recombinase
MAEGLFVAYYRCSTAEQGRSGLGIEAQKETVARYLNGGNWKLIDEFEEHESGTRNDRPGLEAALNQCKRTRATLVIARLDRLSRSAYFITALQESKVRFVCCDMPEANEFTIQIMAALATVEAKRISSNTKAALAQKREWYKEHEEELKAAGERYRLGTDNMTGAGRAKGTIKSAEVRAAAAADRLSLVAGRVQELKKEGLSLKDIAEKLTSEHIQTPRAGGKWHANTVKRIIDKAA